MRTTQHRRHRLRHTRRATNSAGRYGVQSYWSGAPLSLLEKACVVSWVVLGKARVTLYTHDDVAALRNQIPAEIHRHVDVRNADEILSRTEKFDFAGPTPKSKRSNAFKALPFSDIFRYEMLRQRGGIWMDMDLILLRPFPARVLKQPYFFVSERTMQAGAYASKEPTKPTNACIGSRDAHSDWAEWIVGAAKSAKVESAWTFMKVFQESLDALRLHRYVESPAFVMPVNWWDLDGIFLSPSAKKKTTLDAHGCLKKKYGVDPTCPTLLQDPSVIGVHLFRGLLRKRDLPYEHREKIPEDSLYGKMLVQIEAAAGFRL